MDLSMGFRVFKMVSFHPCITHGQEYNYYMCLCAERQATGPSAFFVCVWLKFCNCGISPTDRNKTGGREWFSVIRMSWATFSPFHSFSSIWFHGLRQRTTPCTDACSNMLHGTEYMLKGDACIGLAVTSFCSYLAMVGYFSSCFCWLTP